MVVTKQKYRRYLEDEYAEMIGDEGELGWFGWSIIGLFLFIILICAIPFVASVIHFYVN